MDKYSVEGLAGQFDFVTLAGDSSIEFEGHDVDGGSTKIGSPVVLTGLMQVGFAASGDVPYGTLIRVEADKTVLVGKGGVQEFNIGDTAPGAGDSIVAGADGTVVAGAEGAGVGSVLNVDETRKVAWVDLG